MVAFFAATAVERARKIMSDESEWLVSCANSV